MTYNWEGTQCFHCSRLADCKKVSPSAEPCKDYIQSYIPQSEIAKLFNCSVRTVNRRLKYNREYFIKSLAKKIDGKLIVDVSKDGRTVFWRKDSGN